MSGLQRLSVSGFRGAVQPFSIKFKRDSRLTIIYGENASGKSTICDALELLSRGRVGSLDNRGLGVTTRYWPALGKSATDVSVTLDTREGTCTASMTRSGDVIAQPEDLQPRVEVFRRNQILSLIEAKPAERYGAISRFIDVSGVEASEAALRELVRDLTKQRDGAAARLGENEITIRQFWETEGSPGPDPITWAETASSRKTDDVDAEIDAIRALQSAYVRLTELPARLRAAQQTLTEANHSAEEASAALQEQMAGVAQDVSEVVGILEAAKTYLARHPSPSACPVCESAEKVADLSARIRKRLDAFASFQAAQSRVTASAQAVSRAEQQIQMIRESARQDVVRFHKAQEDRALPSTMPLPEAAIPNNASGLATWVSATASLAEEWKNAEKARHDKRQFANTLKQALDVWRVNQAAVADLDRLLPRMERALKIVEVERRSFVDDILAAIADHVSRLYERVHPGEGLHKIRLELDPKKRASLEIGANFGGQATRPQGYFSESHLDTMAVCIFLALAALDQPENTIIVLDDVLSTVDDRHAERILDLLREESSRFRHCIVTTHHRPWKEKLSSDIDLIELGSWSLTAGLNIPGSQ